MLPAQPPRGTPATPPPPPATPAPIDYTTLVEVIKAAGVHANCDLGNFTDQESQHAGIRAMFPLTDGNCHVKMNPARYDLPKALAITRELGYKGLYSIEAGINMGPDPTRTRKRSSMSFSPISRTCGTEQVQATLFAEETDSNEFKF